MQYELKLKRIRKTAGLTQRQVAEMADVKLATYRTWEQGTAGLSLEKACVLSAVLKCTPNDLCGWSEQKAKEYSSVDRYEQELIECFRQSTKQRKANILQTARDAAGMSKYSAERDQSLPKSG